MFDCFGIVSRLLRGCFGIVSGLFRVCFGIVSGFSSFLKKFLLVFLGLGAACCFLGFSFFEPPGRWLRRVSKMRCQVCI